MRLYTNKEEEKKIVVVEDYTTFKNLLQSKFLFMLLIAYSAFIVISAVLTILDGGYFMGILDIGVHGVVCASLWMFRVANSKENEKFSVKGTKMFQIAHAVKYVILFVLLFVLFIMIFMGWINAGNEANQALVKAKAQTNPEVLKAAKQLCSQTFWKYFGLVIGYLVFVGGVCSYYKAVMCAVNGMVKYEQRGTHFWKELKSLSIYLFITAFLLVFMGILGVTGTVDKLFTLVTVKNYVSIAGGLGIFSLISRCLFAVLCVLFGLVVLKGYKVLSTTETSNDVEVDPETGEVLSQEETPTEEEAPAEEETPALEEAPAEEEVPAEEETTAEEDVPSEEVANDEK